MTTKELDIDQVIDDFKNDFDTKPWMLSLLGDALHYEYIEAKDIDCAIETIIEFDTVEEFENSTENSTIAYQLREIVKLRD